MKGFFLVLVGALVFLAAITLFKVEQTLLWKLSILSTEYGHWLALFCLMLLMVRLFLKVDGVIPTAEVALLLLALAAFIRPVVSTYRHQDAWSSDLKKSFESAAPGKLFSFQQLWFAGKSPSVSPEHMTAANGIDFLFFRPVSSKPTAWVLIVHGGGWDSGSASEFSSFSSYLAQSGYAVASVSYRLAPTWRWPAQRDDVNAAVAYIKSHGKELNVDPDRWAILGRSAGGQIAQAVAYQNDDPSLKGLVAFYTPADMDFAYKYGEEDDIIASRPLIRNFLGGSPEQVPKAYNDASPIFFVNARSTPTLLFHGSQDPLTWNLQSRRLFDQIKKVGGRAVLIEMPWATHAFDFNRNGPGGQVATNAITGFLSAVFKK